MTAAQTAQATADGSITTYYQAAPPWVNGTTGKANNAGDMWFNTTTGQAYRWNDATKNWDVITDQAIGQALAAAQNAQTTADGAITAWYSTAAPWPAADASHDKNFGDIWYDTSNKNKPWYWSGSRAWVSVQDGTIADAQSTANNAMSTANTKIRTFYQTDPPTSSSTGDVWFDTDDGYKQYRASAAGVTAIAVAPAAGWNLVQDALIPQAVTAANGKNTIYYNANPPTVPMVGATFVTGDTWFDLDNGYAISQWDGTQWTPAPFGGSALNQGAITQREINTAYAYVGSLQADQIVGGQFKAGLVVGAQIRTPDAPGGGARGDEPDRDQRHRTPRPGRHHHAATGTDGVQGPGRADRRHHQGHCDPAQHHQRDLAGRQAHPHPGCDTTGYGSWVCHRLGSDHADRIRAVDQR